MIEKHTMADDSMKVELTMLSVSPAQCYHSNSAAAAAATHHIEKNINICKKER